MKKKQAEGWQPIATAPRDGTAVLLKYKENVFVGEYNPEFFKGFPWRFFDSETSTGINGLQDNGFGPTHWQPLPKP